VPACPACGAPVEAGAYSCPVCRAPLVPADDPTRLGGPGSRPSPGEPRRLPAGDPPRPPLGSPPGPPFAGGPRFVPGTVLAGRFRIVALLGRGGMGEVYRADDLKLGEAVALKFLPERVARDGAALARLHREVRTARGVAHPSVCRVFDVGEVDGESFLTMEYVDGEDLASLLRRIGRLPPDKALEIARQLCAGLAAAHARGVLHRDLKPANVMLDGSGRAKLTDFGLAAVAEELGRGDALEGTPAYMAPEQLEGREVTAKSDLYALGLVLYELFTGRRPFPGAGRAEIRRLRTEAAPPTPSSLAEGIDPLTERAILRCLAPDPADRPASALAVAAMLPGGDPLAAALEAGETPSPEMVVASTRERTLPLPVAAACLALSLLLVAGFALVEDDAKLHRQVPLPRSPQQLAFRAAEVAEERGFDLAYTRGRLDYDYETLDRLFAEDVPERVRLERWRRVVSGEQPALVYRFRASPEPIPPDDAVLMEDEPPPSPAEVRLEFDPAGRLLRVDGTPTARTGASASQASPPDAAEDSGQVRRRVFFWVLATLYLLVTAASIVLSRRNLRLGRGDRRGAFRLAAFVFSAEVVGWLLRADHVPALVELRSAFSAIAECLLLAAILWMVYLALEPVVRRRWPGRMVAWSRVLSGDPRDPIVGRDTLVGVAGGLAMSAFILGADRAASVDLGLPGATQIVRPPTLNGPDEVLAALTDCAVGSILTPFAMMVFLVVLYIVLRRTWLAAAGLWVLGTAALGLQAPDVPLYLLFVAAGWGVFTLLLTRFGLFAGCVAQLAFFLTLQWPVFTGFEHWWWPAAALGTGTVVAVAVWGFVTSQGDRLRLGGLLPD